MLSVQVVASSICTVNASVAQSKGLRAGACDPHAGPSRAEAEVLQVFFPPLPSFGFMARLTTI